MGWTRETVAGFAGRTTKMISLVAAAGLALASVGCGGSAFPSADAGSGSIQPFGDSPHLKPGSQGTLEVRLADFDPIAQRQDGELYCWAACASMIHRYHDGPDAATEQEIAERIFPDDFDGDDPDLVSGSNPNKQSDADGSRAASEVEVLLALNPDAREAITGPRAAAVTPMIVQMNKAISKVDRDADYKLAARLLSGPVAKSRINSDHLVANLIEGEPMVASLKADPNVGLSQRYDGDVEAGATNHAVVVVGAEFVWAKSPQPERLEDAMLLGDFSEEVNKALEGKQMVERGAWYKGMALAGKSAMRVVKKRPKRPASKLVSVTVVDPIEGRPVRMTGAEFADRVNYVYSRPASDRILKPYADTFGEDLVINDVTPTKAFYTPLDATVLGKTDTAADRQVQMASEVSPPTPPSEPSEPKQPVFR